MIMLRNRQHQPQYLFRGLSNVSFFPPVDLVSRFIVCLSARKVLRISAYEKENNDYVKIYMKKKIN